MDIKHKKEKTIIGWREWVSLPELGIENIKAKVDTGARTSALHAFDLDVINNNGKRTVKFKMHPLQDNNEYVVECQADVIDERNVTDSGGHKERRLVIKTMVEIGDKRLPIEMTLTDRDTMKFRMLLGRTSLKRNFVVEPGKSYLTRPDIKA
ncbi:MAG: ATP-dependent zinc protease [Thioalkalispiraceae bacterium]|jgi:hypothetical protein